MLYSTTTCVRWCNSNITCVDCSVHSTSHLLLLESGQPCGHTSWVVCTKVICCIGLPKVLPVSSNPLVLGQHGLHLYSGTQGAHCTMTGWTGCHGTNSGENASLSPTQAYILYTQKTHSPCEPHLCCPFGVLLSCALPLSL